MKFLNNLPKTALTLFFLLFISLGFFMPFFTQGKYPVPADTIVGLYHPWRDVVWNGLTQGVPYKNFLITDPVRQQYPWRDLSIDLLKQNQLPLWNPYTLSGTPLSSNFQSAPYYPLNILFLFSSFPFVWSFLVFLQPLLASLFMFFYLRNLNVSKAGSIIGSIVFAFCGFSIAWMTWNTIVHTLLWLPLILLSVDKIIWWIEKSRNRRIILWLLLLFFSLSSSLLAGHLQVFFYVFCFSSLYILSRIIYLKSNKLKTSILVFLIISLSFLVTSPFWIPAIQFISLSSRGVQLNYWDRVEWFIPWPHLVQFIVPDFFGNPSTLNYWGVWNYGEFIGYIGFIPLVLVFYSLLFRRDKKVIWFGSVAFIAFLFALPTAISKLPFILKLPFISTSQPTRLLSIIDFCFSVLAALGFDYVRTQSSNIHIYRKQLVIISGIFTGIFIVLWLWVLRNTPIDEIGLAHLLIAKRNVYFPTITGIVSIVFLTLWMWKTPKNKSLKNISLSLLIIVIIIVDLFRFGWKFTPFVDPSWIFPQTKIISYLQNEKHPFRFMSLDSRIFPPNFSVAFRLQSVEGYDPLYSSRYGEYVGMWIRGKSDISPYDFNRIITPQTVENRLADLANVKYVLSLQDEKSPKLRFTIQEGETRLYENKDVYPRVFLTERVMNATSKQEAANLLMDSSVDLKKTAIIEEYLELPEAILQMSEHAEVLSYKENEVKIQTQTLEPRMLILTDTFYPTWKVYIDGKQDKLYIADYAFRGVVVPAGDHIIDFKVGSLF